MVGRTFSDVPLIANPLESGKTPILSPGELVQLGYDVIIYGLSLILHVTNTMNVCLQKVVDKNGMKKRESLIYHFSTGYATFKWKLYFLRNNIVLFLVC